MAINNASQTAVVPDKTVVLLTMDFARPEPSHFVPHPLNVFVRSKHPAPDEKELSFKVDSEAGDTKSDLHNTFYLRMALAPGDYQIINVFGNANGFPFNGFFFAPLLLDITVPAAPVLYAGRVDLTLRPRVGDEFRAGSIIPLIDQAATGVSSGTFDIKVSDDSEADLPVFRSKFPALAAVDIQSDLLPQWDRDRAQKYWQDH